MKNEDQEDINIKTFTLNEISNILRGLCANQVINFKQEIYIEEAFSKYARKFK